MSTELIYSCINRIIKEQAKIGNLLDIGAGSGHLIRKIISENKLINCHACDYYAEKFNSENIPFKKVNIEEEKLPYEDETFDVITSSEVIEHLQNPRNLVRESYRLLKQDGLLIMTTPNILNMNSRLRFLFSGFYNLFGPIPLNNEDRRSTHGHIMPLSYIYIYLLLFKEGFREITFRIDKRQKSSYFWYCLFFPFLMVGKQRFISKEKNKYKTLDNTNFKIVKSLFEKDLLTGRSLVICARK